ncbi:unnamed protein product [Rhizoctonia solani]|uniref:Uncharacterized protein n=1 Tax=Rhizoctonia solani TaxID=456999 RepID=A0A8H3AHB7_9AGAM|nr:unnamed protein product [Rhizoctonia solani]CAE7151224.1 unnamed protein product [Rhizoctonia solani]
MLAVFDEYGSLPGHLVNPAKQVMKFSGYFLNVSTNQFDWVAYKNAIDNRPDYNLIIEAYESQSIAQTNDTVSTMVDRIGQVIYRAAGSETGFDKDAMTERVKYAFTTLQIQEDSGFAYWERSGSNSAFTYRILFATPNKYVDTDFYSLVTTVKLTADIYEKSTWFGLSYTSRHNFSAQIDTIRLACSKDFVAGPRP